MNEHIRMSEAISRWNYLLNHSSNLQTTASFKFTERTFDIILYVLTYLAHIRLRLTVVTAKKKYQTITIFLYVLRNHVLTFFVVQSLQTLLHEEMTSDTFLNYKIRWQLNRMFQKCWKILKLIWIIIYLLFCFTLTGLLQLS